MADTRTITDQRDRETDAYLDPDAAKPAQTVVPVHPLIAERWSPRAFSDEEVDHEDVRTLLEAARWAPSSFNEQPWRFVVGSRGDQAYERIASSLVEANAVWATQAPVLVLSVAKRTFDVDGRENRHALHDVGLAVANLTLQATALGLVVHQMGGFDAEHARDALEIPGGYEPVAAIAIGYPGEPDQLPDELAEHERAPRERLEATEILHGATWGETPDLLEAT